MSTLHHARRPLSPEDPSARPSDTHVCLTQRDLAERWHLSPRTLERWRWLKRGPRYLAIGGHVRYRLEDIEAFEAAQLRGDSL